ncbi:MAG: hypothetical protein GVY04_16530 [Cyanobacteria bacterium]|nr:hypothetical protein [Cyanobacteria bacterium GSL.Bin1]
MNPSHRGNWGQEHMMQNLTPEERKAIQECHDYMHQNWQSMMRHMQEAHPEMYRNQYNHESQQHPQ